MGTQENSIRIIKKKKIKIKDNKNMNEEIYN